MNLATFENLNEGDEVDVTYSSTYGDERGETRTETMTVTRVDVSAWSGEDAVSVDVGLHAERYGDEGDHLFTDRLFEAMFFEGEFQFSKLSTKNGGRWNRISRSGSDPTMSAVETEARPHVTMWQARMGDEAAHVDTFDAGYEFGPEFTLATFARCYEPHETLLDTTDLDEAFRSLQGHVVNAEQNGRHMVPSASVGDVFEVVHADGSTEFHLVKGVGFERVFA